MDGNRAETSRLSPRARKLPRDRRVNSSSLLMFNPGQHPASASTPQNRHHGEVQHERLDDLRLASSRLNPEVSSARSHSFKLDLRSARDEAVALDHHFQGGSQPAYGPAERSSFAVRGEWTDGLVAVPGEWTDGLVAAATHQRLWREPDQLFRR